MSGEAIDRASGGTVIVGKNYDPLRHLTSK